jgi:hypothetical protein
MFEKLCMVLNKDAEWFEYNTGISAPKLQGNVAVITDLFQLYCLCIAEIGRLRVMMDDSECDDGLSRYITTEFSAHIKMRQQELFPSLHPSMEDLAAEHLRTLEIELCELFKVDELEIFDFQLKYKFVVDGITRF